MKRRRLWFIVMGTGFTCAVTAAVPWTHAPRLSEAAAPEEAPVVSALSPAPAGTRHAPASARPAPAPRKTVNLAKVQASIDRLNALQTQISQRELDREQALMREKAREFARVEAPEPTRTPYTEEGGQRWVRLAYPGGEVRYEFPEE